MLVLHLFKFENVWYYNKFVFVLIFHYHSMVLVTNFGKDNWHHQGYMNLKEYLMKKNQVYDIMENYKIFYYHELNQDIQQNINKFSI